MGEEIIIVGGGNSAGQAAVFLSQTCHRVRLMVRSDGLSDTMSRYLIRRIEDSPNITLSTRTELCKLEGAGWLERVTWRSTVSGTTETGDIKHVFLMTGAVPNTGWLAGCVALDEKGFVRTGLDSRPMSYPHAMPYESSAVPLRNRSAGHLRRRRRPLREHQACGRRRR